MWYFLFYSETQHIWRYINVWTNPHGPGHDYPMDLLTFCHLHQPVPMSLLCGSRGRSWMVTTPRGDEPLTMPSIYHAVYVKYEGIQLYWFNEDNPLEAGEQQIRSLLNLPRRCQIWSYSMSHVMPRHVPDMEICVCTMKTSLCWFHPHVKTG